MTAHWSSISPWDSHSPMMAPMPRLVTSQPAMCA
eukprot:CAMPEP_0179090020 /NCGR_PEP_ID=MMETSP0796-20121207/41048_1 /TAXON_ID=73915 /ORGANISM="Pyrodinium bahamense, Strain pbaha01" /LENGTH=33 /DNA_ID= /DNA_START= /DNA_END= /DNA_ORIENTATION=